MVAMLLLSTGTMASKTSSSPLENKLTNESTHPTRPQIDDTKQ
jgi:hypothetical protein